MKKFVFSLVLCLFSIFSYAQCDTIFVPQSRVTKDKLMVMTIPDSVLSAKATFDQNVRAWYYKENVVLFTVNTIKHEWFGINSFSKTERLFFNKTTGVNTSYFEIVLLEHRNAWSYFFAFFVPFFIVLIYGITRKTESQKSDFKSTTICISGGFLIVFFIAFVTEVSAEISFFIPITYLLLGVLTPFLYFVVFKWRNKEIKK